MERRLHSESYEYRLWGQVIQSDLDLGLQLPPSNEACSAPVRIRRVPRHRLDECSRTESLECLNEDGSIWVIISRSGAGYLLVFPSLCSFYLDAGNLDIEYAPQPGAQPSTIIHLLLDHALPRLISLLRGYFVLHASSCLVGETAIMLLGQSGAGKSTLASWFGAQGYPILTDDCLVLHRDPDHGGWAAMPSYPSVRLWPDSIHAIGVDPSGLREVAHYSTKRRTDETQEMLHFAVEPVPLGGVFVLKTGDSGECLVERCSVSEAFAALSLGVFRLEIASPELNRREFGILTDLLENIPFWSVTHGNDYTQLPELQRRMLEVLR